MTSTSPLTSPRNTSLTTTRVRRGSQSSSSNNTAITSTTGGGFTITSSTTTTPANKVISNYEVIKLLKQAENRFCADCTAPLTNTHHTYASIEYGVWLCLLCADTHRNIFPHSVAQIKSAEETWYEIDIRKMIEAKGNAHQNLIFEHYLPTAWPKIHPTSAYKERKQWIRAKYYGHYFMIPQIQEHQLFPQSANKSTDSIRSNKSAVLTAKQRQDRIEQSTTLPPRIVDYFLTVNISKFKGNRSKDKMVMTTKVEDWLFGSDLKDMYPAKQYADTPIPELVGSMVFPHGLHISHTEHPPHCFSFVLTDINRIKLYGMTLVIYELIEPSTLLGLLPPGNMIENYEEVKAFIHQKVFYAPKALTLLSHYPFFNLFQLFLTELYHVSLSSNVPLPLERYIVNFMHELPLPPLGKTEVVFYLPEYIVNITRPPSNQLPMIDFSYQPLFTFLSIDHILLIFKCLCLEMTIAICCSNIALLTPIQEALLSFLFPLVWQGCYVPILPSHMMELLDAPVPLLVGLHDQYLANTDPAYRPPHVVFVHIDTDQVMMGTEAVNIIQNTTLPKSKVGKLKQKLQEHSSHCYERQDKVQLLKTAGYPFLHNEHLTSINKFISEQGIVIPTQANAHHTFSTSQFMSSLNKLGIRRASTATPSTVSNNTSTSQANHNITSPSTKSTTGSNTAPNTPELSSSHTNAAPGVLPTGYEAVPYRHPAACTLITSSMSSPHIWTHSLLNAENNYHASSTTSSGSSSTGSTNTNSFNAKEIREAFLRFFVASLIDYEDFFLSNKKNTNKEEDRDTHDEKNFFDKAGFKNSLQDEFLSRLVDSQMFSNFLSEKHDSSSKQMELMFFDENIIAKKNRSKLLLAKSSTPFLSDDKDFLREAYTTPLPSTQGIDRSSNGGFSYNAFPHLQEKYNYAPRSAQLLVNQPERSRLRDKHNQAMTYLQEQLLALKQQQQQHAQSSKSEQPSTVDRSNTNSPSFGSEDQGNQDEFFDMMHHRYEQTLFGLVMFQTYLHYTKKLRSRYLRMKTSKILIWRYYLNWRKRRQARYKQYVQDIIRLQSWYRAHFYQQRFERFMYSVRYLQAHQRRRKIQRKYHHQRNSTITIQRYYHGYHIRTQQKKWRQAQLKLRRELVGCLWNLEHTSLQFRSIFYLSLTQSTYWSLALYQVELERLFASLHLSQTLGNGFTNQSFEEKCRLVKDWTAIKQMKDICTKGRKSPAEKWKELSSEMRQFCQQFLRQMKGCTTQEQQRYQYLMQQEEDERQTFYKLCKESLLQKQLNPTEEEKWFSYYQISNQGHRKKKMMDFLWLKCDEEEDCIMAANIVSVLTSKISISSGNPSKFDHVMTKEEFIQRRDARLRKHMLDSIHAFMIAIQRERPPPTSSKPMKKQ